MGEVECCAGLSAVTDKNGTEVGVGKGSLGES